MDKEEARNNGGPATELALKESLLKSVALLEDCRKFMAVARHALKNGSNNSTELTEAILSFMIARLDPVLNNIYANTPDYSLVNSVFSKIQDPTYYEDSVIDFVEIFDENGNLIKSSLDESPE